MDKYKVNLKNKDVEEALFLLRAYGMEYSFLDAVGGVEIAGTYNQVTFEVKFKKKYENLNDFLSSVFHELAHHIINCEGMFRECYRPDFYTKKGKENFKKSYFKMELATDDLGEELMKHHFPKRKYIRGYFNTPECRKFCLNYAEGIIKEKENTITALRYLRKFYKDEKLRKTLKSVI